MTMSNINTTGISGLTTNTSESKTQSVTTLQAQKSKSDVQNQKETDLSSTQQVASVEDLEETVSDLNAKLASKELSVALTMDDDSGHLVVKIQDSKTGKLVRQIPSEETLKFAQNVQKGIGVVVDSEY